MEAQQDLYSLAQSDYNIITSGSNDGMDNRFAIGKDRCYDEALAAHRWGGGMAHDLPGPPKGVTIRPEPGEHQPTVLVVEDDEPTRLAMTSILAREGYLVLGAATGHDALETLRTPLSSIDVVILDVHLPDVSGIDLCARLRELYPKLPVVICTGEANPAEVARLLELGAHRYFQKPISPEEILATVEAALP